jgi:hypothetical protein
LPEQKQAMDVMAANVPRDRFPEVVAWWFPLIGFEDRENITRIWQMVLPPPAFDGIREIIRKVSGSDWDKLKQRIPGL